MINCCWAQGDSLQISQDGYIRMSLPVFMELPLVHFLSGLDNEPICQSVEGGKEASISGYSEWLSDTSPRVTVVGLAFRSNYRQPTISPRGMPGQTSCLSILSMAKISWRGRQQSAIAFGIDLRPIQ